MEQKQIKKYERTRETQEQINNEINKTFPLLYQRKRNEIILNARKEISKANGDTEGLRQVMTWHGLQYKNNALKKTLRFLQRKTQKEIYLIEEKLYSIATAKDWEPDKELIITIEWKPSRMWGANPKAHTNYGFEGSSIGGCGYDKKSTATAEALNSDLSILKLMYRAKEKALKDNILVTGKNDVNYPKPAPVHADKSEEHNLNVEVLGYGSGYGVLPYFEGGVGTYSHTHTCKAIGLKMDLTASGKTFDVFRITQEAQK